MTDEDFEAAAVEHGLQARSTSPTSSRTSRSTRSCFRRTYFLGPQEGGEKTYALLVRALDETGLAGVVKYVMRDRQNLGCLRVREGVLTLEQMYFADEIRPADGIKPKGARVDKRQLGMATRADRGVRGRVRPDGVQATRIATRSARSSRRSGRARRSTGPSRSRRRARPT